MENKTSIAPKDVPKDEASLQQETGSNHVATQQGGNKRARQEGTATTAPVVGPPQLSEQAAAACSAGRALKLLHAGLMAEMAAGMAAWPDIFKLDQLAKALQEHFIADRGSAYCRLSLEFLVSVHAQKALVLTLVAQSLLMCMHVVPLLLLLCWP